MVNIARDEVKRKLIKVVTVHFVWDAFWMVFLGSLGTFGFIDTDIDHMLWTLRLLGFVVLLPAALLKLILLTRECRYRTQTMVYKRNYTATNYFQFTVALTVLCIQTYRWNINFFSLNTDILDNSMFVYVMLCIF